MHAICVFVVFQIIMDQLHLCIGIMSIFSGQKYCSL